MIYNLKGFLALWKGGAIGKSYLKELKIPGHIPDGYDFSNLRITNNHRNEYRALSNYENSENEILMIIQENLSDYNSVFQMTGIEDDFYVGDMHVFYSPDAVTDYGSICAITESEKVTVTGLLTLDELVTILEMLE